MSDNWPEEYLDGIRFFNEGEWYEAHEAWEEYWKLHSGSGNNYYKGLIQIAVALLHWQRKNPSGARKLWQSGSSYLRKYPAIHMGICLDQWLEKVDALFSPWASTWVKGDPCPEFPQESIPKLLLQSQK